MASVHDGWTRKSSEDYLFVVEQDVVLRKVDNVGVLWAGALDGLDVACVWGIAQGDCFS